MSRSDPVETIGRVRLCAPTAGCASYRLRWAEPDGSPGVTTAGRKPAAALTKAPPSTVACPAPPDPPR